MSPKARRLSVIIGIGGMLSIAAMLVLSALQDNIVFFYTPTEIKTSGAKSGQALRLGGLVKTNSVMIDGLQSIFTITDGLAEITVTYNGALPSLFREGQGVVDHCDDKGGSIGEIECTLVIHNYADLNLCPRIEHLCSPT